MGIISSYFTKHAPSEEGCPETKEESTKDEEEPSQETKVYYEDKRIPDKTKNEPTREHSKTKRS